MSEHRPGNNNNFNMISGAVSGLIESVQTLIF